jgi:hypothetical protein
LILTALVAELKVKVEFLDRENNELSNDNITNRRKRTN